MADRLLVPDEDLVALARGEAIVAFAARHEVDLNDELELVAGGPRSAGGPTETPPDGLVGLVVGLQPASSIAGPVPADLSDGDAGILRVFDEDGPVLADVEFESRRSDVEAMFR
ncbi:MAG: hypothetical protein HKO63_01765 [Acidimicrobiia bacterium]|nr:hypothetical protein [Acidimicrobiia bacterium]